MYDKKDTVSDINDETVDFVPKTKDRLPSSENQNYPNNFASYSHPQNLNFEENLSKTKNKNYPKKNKVKHKYPIKSKDF